MSYVEQTVTFGEKTLSDIIAIVDNKEVFTQLLIDFNIDTSNPDKKLNYCSEGEKKKVAIAKSLSSNNNILVWDEPLNFIDIISMEQIEKAILEFLPTMIFVEHDSTFGENIATKIIELAP